MRRRWIALAVAAALLGGACWYYYAAWSTARDWAVAVAAGDPDVPLDGNAWALGRDLPHEQLIVVTGSGWRELSDQLAIDFTISDPSSSRTVGMRVTVEFGWDGWSVIGGGDTAG